MSRVSCALWFPICKIIIFFPVLIYYLMTLTFFKVVYHVADFTGKSTRNITKMTNQNLQPSSLLCFEFDLCSLSAKFSVSRVAVTRQGHDLSSETNTREQVHPTRLRAP